MYDVIKNIIQHSWDTQSYSSSEQQIIYYICGAVIIVLVVVFVDLMYRLFRHFWRQHIGEYKKYKEDKHEDTNCDFEKTE